MPEDGHTKSSTPRTLTYIEIANFFPAQKAEPQTRVSVSGMCQAKEGAPACYLVESG